MALYRKSLTSLPSSVNTSFQFYHFGWKYFKIYFIFSLSFRTQNIDYCIHLFIVVHDYHYSQQLLKCPIKLISLEYMNEYRCTVLVPSSTFEILYSHPLFFLSSSFLSVVIFHCNSPITSCKALKRTQEVISTRLKMNNRNESCE